MAARASWKGHLKVGDLACAVGLYTAISSSDRVSFNIINRKTGHRVERQFVDSETGKPVERDDQVKGYQMENGDYLVIEGDEIAQLMPESDKVLNIKAFIGYDDIDKLYFDRPYYLAPVDEHDEEALLLIARGMRDGKVAALAEAVLFRRNRTLLIRPHDDCIVATMLNFDYEVRSADTVFKDIPDIKFDKEMIALAGHIIGTKQGSFEPSEYVDRYEAALVELVKAKIEGRAPPKKKQPPERKVVDLMEALRQSAGMSGKSSAKPPAPKKAPARSDSPSKKAG
ncbi:DNA end-binding protein Ku [Rhizobium leguminosarum]|uniref:Non-homologous end joining protein Ku n=1 Tax=Rhizobium leguminosarum TaxID=384 RepID=A0AAE2MFK1_RHILE|nr:MULTISPECIES: Ku protein [Rhizobium]MBB4288413.1 DNA end-binding protein Ku [Rhizobium leguminosarum]MBB4295494.1 DNA end-binding protein Ku [Rhizobium leguminosarum]MBB4306888.1 DNA end-binding protein Ku [Rhizobium leguminosarum]MBB4417530.1 DNA end-binding protein Ku [Rhizobium leguminosarum]MBB4432374.1 DNA end-binding protein Ku [Rhizobium esperanzae]